MVLAYTAAADPRFNTTDQDQAQARVFTWTDLLADVPADFALDRVRRYYRSHHDWPITPGSIRDAWRHHLTRLEALAPRQALPAPAIRPETTQLLGSVREQITANRDAYYAVRHHPRGPRHAAPADDQP